MKASGKRFREGRWLIVIKVLCIDNAETSRWGAQHQVWPTGAGLFLNNILKITIKYVFIQIASQSAFALQSTARRGGQPSEPGPVEELTSLLVPQYGFKNAIAKIQP